MRTAIDDLSKGHLLEAEKVDLSYWEAEARFIRSRLGLEAENDDMVRRWARDDIHER